MILQTSPNKDLTSIHNWAGTGIVKKKNRSTVVEWDIGATREWAKDILPYSENSEFVVWCLDELSLNALFL